MDSEKFHKVSRCRICGNENLITVLDLGDQYLSGIFPKEIDPEMYRGPLKLVKCGEDTLDDATEEYSCGHVQLEHTFDLPTMYGQDYGYRSGLNASMVKHLKSKCEKILDMVELTEDDLVIDIAGNDGTFLSFFPEEVELLSVDPTASKFKEYYPEHVKYVADFFSHSLLEENTRFGGKAKVITSFSMFYDLEDPCAFAREVRRSLKDDGIWVLEQSYMPEMLKQNSFDTVCHEHLSYYGMRQLKYIMDNSGFKIIDFEFNDINGGSISVVVAKDNVKSFVECTERVEALIQEEIDAGLNSTTPWTEFQTRITSCREEFKTILNGFKKKKKKIAALGASTKGNVTLQTWGITPEDIKVVGEVNPDKEGSFTPGTWIPIDVEDKVLEEYDVFVILPWHFKEFFVKNEKFKGKTLIFPLPAPEVVTL